MRVYNILESLRVSGDHFLAAMLVIFLTTTSFILLTTNEANWPCPHYDSEKPEEDLPIIRIIELEGEKIVIRGVNKTAVGEGNKLKTAIVIYDYMFFHNSDDINAYIARKRVLLKKCAEKWPSLRTLAIVNPVEPLNMTQYIELGKELIEKYNLTILAIRFRSYPHGGGSLSVEPGGVYPSSEHIKQVEEVVAKRMNITSLIDTVIGIKVEGELRDLVRAQKHSKISLVDIGQLETAFNYLPKEEASRVEVICTRYETALLAYNMEGELFFVVVVKPPEYLIENASPRV